MRYIFPLIAVVAAIPESLDFYSALDLPILHGRGLYTSTPGKKGHMKMRFHKGKDVLENDSIKTEKRRANSPPKEGDTYASAKITGPGEIAVARKKDENSTQDFDKEWLNPGETLRKDTRDQIWSKAMARAHGDPPRGAARQSNLLHPAKADGAGKSGYARAIPPIQGGYAKLKKEVNGEVVQDQRIPPGQEGYDTHIGTQPGEVKYTVSSSRGGEVRVGVNN